MIKLIYILLLSIGFGTVLHVPGDWSTIQGGIDAANEGDTVLVAQGVYYENLIIQKSINLFSRAVFDDLSNWVEYNNGSSEYEITNDNINNTIINGSGNSIGNLNFQSVILIDTPPGGECITPIIKGFTIEDGRGTLVQFTTTTGFVREEIKGGGFIANNARPELNYNLLKENNGTEEAQIYSGGGGLIGDGNTFPILSGYSWGESSSCQDQGRGWMELSRNVFRKNKARYGYSFKTENVALEVNMQESVFDVYDYQESDVAQLWVNIDQGTEEDPIYSSADLSEGVGDLNSINQDVYVSKSGSNLNEGTSADQPFLTINRALEMISPNDNNQLTIYLSGNDVFSPTNGDQFPIMIQPNVHLVGLGIENTTIDAEDAETVIIFDNVRNTSISDFTITGGCGGGINTDCSGSPGGGIMIEYANPNLTNLHIETNYGKEGGGIYMYAADPVLRNVRIENNQNKGLYIHWSDPVLYDCVITDNIAPGAGNDANGGGIFAWYSNITMIGGEVSYNTSGNKGGGIDFRDSNGLLSGLKIHHNNAGDEQPSCHGGGGINLENSSPTILDSEIYENHGCASNISAYCSGGGIRWKHGEGDPLLINVLIRDNTAYSWAGVKLKKPTLINVTIINNNFNDSQGSQAMMSGGIINNSIIRGSSNPLIKLDYELNPAQFVEYDNIHYSNIQGGNSGIENTSGDPEFSGNYTPTSSHCVDVGDPNIWYNEPNGTRSDMGWTGGPYFYTTINGKIEMPVDQYNFGIVGSTGSLANWRLYNFGDSDIIITNIYNQMPSFIINVQLPLTIGSHQTGLVEINANNTAGVNVEDDLYFTSNQLPAGAAINLSLEHSSLSYVLNGGLPSYIEAQDYTVHGDIIIDAANSSTIEAGTKFLFDGPYKFTIEGQINVAGTYADSIYFINKDPNVSEGNKWLGIFMYGENSSSSSINYAKMSGVQWNEALDPFEEFYGFTMNINLSHPSLNNLFIDNSAKGIRLHTSNPTLDNVHIFHCTQGLLMYENSEPTISNSKFNYNTEDNVAVVQSFPTFNNCEFSHNTSNSEEGGTGINTYQASAILNHCKFQNNQSKRSGSAIFCEGNSDKAIQINNCLITNNTVLEAYPSRGGAIALQNTNNFVYIRNTTIADNIVSSPAGYYSNDYPAGIYMGSLHNSEGDQYPKVALFNSIIYNNKTTSDNSDTKYHQIGWDKENGRGAAAMVWCRNSIGHINGTDPFDNISWGEWDPYNEPPIIWSCQDDLVFGQEGYFNVDPLFTSDYRLSLNSPLINVGVSTFKSESIWWDYWDDDWQILYNDWNTYGGGVGVKVYHNLPSDWGTYVIGQVNQSEVTGDAPDLGAYEHCNFDIDCAGVCGGYSELDNCDICDTNFSNNCVEDCAGIWGGNSVYNDYWFDSDGDGLGSGPPDSFCEGLVPSELWVLNSDDIDDNCASNTHDYCGVCNGDDSSCEDCNGVINGLDEYDVCGECGGNGWSCVAMGDVNQDLEVNIFDLIMIVEYILFEDYYFSADQYSHADANYDNWIDVSDVVIFIESIFNQLGRTIDVVEEISIIKTNDGLYIESSGFIALDIQISHLPNFEYEMTSDAFLSKGVTNDNTTRMIIAELESDLIFNTDNYYTIDNIIAVTNGGNAVEVNILYLTDFHLSPAYPNPFNPTTTLSFALPQKADVSIIIYDIQGRVVTTLINSTMQTGYHKAIWDASHHASGLYFVQMIAGEYVNTQKIMLVK